MIPFPLLEILGDVATVVIGHQTKKLEIAESAAARAADNRSSRPADGRRATAWARGTSTAATGGPSTRSPGLARGAG
ncbi:hypothetical protein [Dactylosporangium sp. NPDC049140]|uniref:hypothetical protein n=1 Tax=Dactylosporangium sp. NPDC049140 TaxID=3155647 RepID=UPI003411DEF3